MFYFKDKNTAAISHNKPTYKLMYIYKTKSYRINL